MSQCSKRKEIEKILDPKEALHANYLDDQIYLACQAFKKVGITLDDLFCFQKEVPIVYPWDDNYDKIRQVVNRRFNIYPMGIVMATKRKHVVQAVNFCRDHNIPMAIRGGSHCFEGYSVNEGIVIDQSLRKKIRIDPKTKQGILEAGCLLGPTAEAISQYGLALPAGTNPSVGCLGLALGGGIGFLSRKFGITTDNILEAEVVLPSGKMVVANKDKNSDLYWALKGAGGSNFGIVTNLKIQLYELPEVYVYEVLFDFKYFKEVLKNWQSWAYDVDINLSSEFHFYDNETNTVSVTGEYFPTIKGDETGKIKDLLSPMLTTPYTSLSIQKVKYLDAVKKWGSSGAFWLPFFKGKNAFLKEPFSDAALDVIVKYLRTGSGKDIFELTSLGGKIDDVPVDGAAFPHRGYKYWLLINFHFTTLEETILGLKRIDDFYRELKPFLEEGTYIKSYVNIPDRDLDDCLQSYYGSNLQKLIEVKKKYNPHGLFDFLQAVKI
jgi:hypothetical protein